MEFEYPELVYVREEYTRIEGGAKAKIICDIFEAEEWTLTLGVRGWFEDEAPNDEFIAIVDAPVGTLGLVKVDDKFAKMQFYIEGQGVKETVSTVQYKD